MTAATKKKLTELTNKVNVMTAEAQSKSSSIKVLLIGLAGLAVVVAYFVFLKRRRG